MTRARVVAALTAILLALLVQAVLIGPVFSPAPVSLPAVLVAAVALTNGAGTGISFGFSAGLLADLGSSHPAGVLALCWLGIGLVCGMGRSDIGTVRRDAAYAAVVCAAWAVVATIALTVLHADGASALVAVRGALPTAIGDALLALVIVPLVRVVLRRELLRAPTSSRPILLADRTTVMGSRGAAS